MENKMIGRLALAAAVVLMCSVDARAQHVGHGPVYNRTVVNVFPGGWRGGGWPIVGYGYGYYDMAGVAAANASIVNNLIASGQRPYYPVPPPVVYQPAPACRSYLTGVNPAGGPVYITSCQ